MSSFTVLYGVHPRTSVTESLIEPSSPTPYDRRGTVELRLLREDVQRI